MQGAVTPDGLALFAAFVRLLPLVTGCNRPKAAIRISEGSEHVLEPCHTLPRQPHDERRG